MGVDGRTSLNFVEICASLQLRLSHFDFGFYSAKTSQINIFNVVVRYSLRSSYKINGIIEMHCAENFPDNGIMLPSRDSIFLPGIKAIAPSKYEG